MGERAKLGVIGMVGWGALLLVYQVILKLNEAKPWDNYCTLLASLVAASMVAGLIGNRMDYKADMRDIESFKTTVLGDPHDEWVRRLIK